MSNPTTFHVVYYRGDKSKELAAFNGKETPKLGR